MRHHVCIAEIQTNNQTCISCCLSFWISEMFSSLSRSSTRLGTGQKSSSFLGVKTRLSSAISLASLVKLFSYPCRPSSLFGSVAVSSLNLRPSREILRGLKVRVVLNSCYLQNGSSVSVLFTCGKDCPQWSCSGTALSSMKPSALVQSWWSPEPRLVDVRRSPWGG